MDSKDVETYYNSYKYLLQLSTSNIVIRGCCSNVIHNWFRRPYRFLAGFALKRIFKILAVIVGIFFAALMYFQSQNLISVNWDKIQSMSQGMVSMPAHSLTDSGQISTIAGNLGIPLTGGLAAGFAIGVMKG